MGWPTLLPSCRLALVNVRSDRSRPLRARAGTTSASLAALAIALGLAGCCLHSIVSRLELLR
jgi:hypothetical protein